MTAAIVMDPLPTVGLRHDCDTKFRDEMKKPCKDHRDDLEDA